MAEQAQCQVVYEFGEAGPRIDVRAAWINSLKPGDVAWLPRLDALALPKKARGKMRATTDLASAIALILGQGAIIEDGETGITSRDGERWKTRVEWAMRKVAAGRLSRAQARARGKKGAAVIKAKSVELRWSSDMMRAERERWSSVWRDPVHRNDQDAADAIDVDELRGRKWLCRRIFKERRPGDKKAGGRPRKGR